MQLSVSSTRITFHWTGQRNAGDLSTHLGTVVGCILLDLTERAHEASNRPSATHRTERYMHVVLLISLMSAKPFQR